MQRRTTSHDVARVAGVSQSTVSLVLNGRANTRISESTRQRVLEAARALNYTRNTAAHAIVTGRTHRFGIVPIHPRAFMDHNAYYGTLTTSFIDGAFRHGYNLLLHSVAYAHWEELYRDICSGSTDGVILIGRTSNDPLTHALLEADFPTVCVSYQPRAPIFYSVDCDNMMGGYLAVQHLLSLGHRRIGYFRPSQGFSWEMQRYEGAKRAIAEADLPADSLYFLGDGNSAPTAENVIDLLCDLPDTRRPTALICQDDQQGEHLIRSLPHRGLRVPHDIALISFNSTEICGRSNPRQTSVWQPLAQIGGAAVDMLVDIFEGKAITSSTLRFPMCLNIRESCGGNL